jgi:hypothetical protein
MASSIRFTPQTPKVEITSVCYRLTPTGDIQHGFLRTVSLGEETLTAEIVKLNGSDLQTVGGATQCACPVGGGGTGTVINNHLTVFRNKVTFALVFAVTVINNGIVTTNYYDIDGNVYIGGTDNLELAGDNLNYSSPQLMCLNGTMAVTRVDIWDEHGVKLSSVWQDLYGAVVPTPIQSDTLTAGSCDRPMTVTTDPYVDNFLDGDSNPTGEYVLYVQHCVSEPSGAIATSLPRLVGGNLYTVVGRISRVPLLPPVIEGLVRLTAGQSWESDFATQSVAWTIERANNSPNHVTVGEVEFTSVGYDDRASVDGSSDPFIKCKKITAHGSARVLVQDTRQAQLVNRTPTTLFDPLDTLIPVPDGL